MNFQQRIARSDAILAREDLTLGQKVTYQYLLNRADGDGICWPCVETIAFGCGCRRRTVQLHLRVLEAKGFLSRMQPSGPLLERFRLMCRRSDRLPAVYQLHDPTDRYIETSDPGNGVHRHAPRRADAAHGDAPRTPTESGPDTGLGAAMGRHDGAHGDAPRTYHGTNQEQNKPTAGTASGPSAAVDRAGANDLSTRDVGPSTCEGRATDGEHHRDGQTLLDANVEALTRAGIGEPTRSCLARRPGVSPALVERAAANVDGRGGSGLLVCEIEALADQAAAGPPSKSRREERQCRQQVEFAADREKARQEQIRREHATRELEGQFTEEECARAFQEYVQDQPERVRPLYANYTWSFLPQPVLEKLAPGRLDELLAEGGDDGNRGQGGSG